MEHKNAYRVKNARDGVEHGTYEKDCTQQHHHAQDMAAQQDCSAVNLAIAVGCPQLTYGCPDDWYGDEKQEEVVFVWKSVVEMKFKKPYPENKYHTVSKNNK